MFFRIFNHPAKKRGLELSEIDQNFKIEFLLLGRILSCRVVNDIKLKNELRVDPFFTSGKCRITRKIFWKKSEGKSFSFFTVFEVSWCSLLLQNGMRSVIDFRKFLPKRGVSREILAPPFFSDPDSYNKVKKIFS